MTEAEKIWWDELLERSRRRKQQRLFTQRCWSVLKPVLSAALMVCSIYSAMFCWRFEVFGLPAINRERGWLGPVIRHDQNTPDIGGVGYYDGSDYRLYEFYRPLCHAWIWLNGLPYGEFR